MSKVRSGAYSSRSRCLRMRELYCWSVPTKRGSAILPPMYPGYVLCRSFFPVFRFCLTTSWLSFFSLSFCSLFLLCLLSLIAQVNSGTVKEQLPANHASLVSSKETKTRLFATIVLLVTPRVETQMSNVYHAKQAVLVARKARTANCVARANIVKVKKTTSGRSQ